jgi:DMSO reductase family type II enzyme heme b subunit
MKVLMPTRGKWRRWVPVVLAALGIVGVWLLAPSRTQGKLVPAGTGGSGVAAAQSTSGGQAIYEQRCAGCHGLTGEGQGPVTERLFVKPRDFTRDEYEIKSTAGDEFPSREDLIRTVAEGMPGSSMPAWRGVLSEAEIGAVVDYVQTFGRFFSQEGYGTTMIEVPRRVRPTEESLARGQELYLEEMECFRCHGLAGRGDGQSALELTDNAGNVIYPADLTQPWRFRGGGEAEDIYLRLHTGMPGTPMPSFADALSAEDTWHLVNFVLSLAPEEALEPAVLLVSQYVDGPLPADLDDPAWDELEPAYYPLAGQIMRAPRHYEPAIDSVMVRSLYNEGEVAFYVTWNDRTESREGEAVDAIAIQFPQELSEGTQRPYFVFGDPARAVYQWYWSAGTNEVVEQNANGLEAVGVQPEERWQTTSVARYQDGQWQVLFRRPFQSNDDNDLSFVSGRFIPIAFMAWDGYAGEAGERMGLTTWSLVYMPSPLPLVQYGWIPVVMIAIAAAETLVVWRVRRADRISTSD